MAEAIANPDLRKHPAATPEAAEAPATPANSATCETARAEGGKARLVGAIRSAGGRVRARATAAWEGMGKPAAAAVRRGWGWVLGLLP